MDERYYQLKIELLGAEPAIWRRFVVPAGIFLDELHEIIQIVMGWENCHSYDFVISKKRYRESADILVPEYPIEEYRLAELVKQKKHTFSYRYDFGDDWNHKLVVEDSNYILTDEKQVACLAGERACPLEDSGGPWRYMLVCEILQNPLHEEYEEYIECFGEECDSETFDITTVNRKLKKYWDWVQNDADDLG